MFVTISRQSIKTPLRAKLKPTQPDPKPHGYESGVCACFRHEKSTFSDVNCAACRRNKAVSRFNNPNRACLLWVKSVSLSKKPLPLDFRYCPVSDGIGAALQYVAKGQRATLALARYSSYSITSSARSN